MKYIIAITLLFCVIESKSQIENRPIENIQLFFDKDGKEAARLDLNTGKWDITNAFPAIDSLYKQLRSVTLKYNIIYNMLMLVHDGKVAEKDKQRWKTLLSEFIKANK